MIHITSNAKNHILQYRNHVLLYINLIRSRPHGFRKAFLFELKKIYNVPNLQENQAFEGSRHEASKNPRPSDTVWVTIESTQANLESSFS